MRCAVYDLLLDGKLYYVGTSGNPEKRFETHKYAGLMPRRITLRVVKWYDTKREALDAERRRIKQMNPPANEITDDAKRYRKLDDELSRSREKWSAIWSGIYACILKAHRSGMSAAEIAKGYPNVTAADVRKAIRHAEKLEAETRT